MRHEWQKTRTPHSLKHLPVIAIEGPQSAQVQDQLAQFM